MILAIETSTSVSSVALAGDGGVVAAREISGPRAHVEFLMPAIREMLEESGSAMKDLSLVAVGLGPGLFTGMRVGIATAKTIAQMLGLGMVGVSSLDNLARQALQESRPVCACIDARRAEVFAAFYEGGRALGTPATFTPEDLAAQAHEPTLFIGDGAVAYAPVLARAGEVRAAAPTAAVLCEIALGLEPVSPDLIEPLYVRKSEAEIKWENRGVQPQRPNRVKIAGER